MGELRAAAYDLDDYVGDLCRLMDREESIPRAVQEVEELNRRLLRGDFRLPAHLRRLHPTAPYTRNLVYQAPDRRFTVIAILWGRFQETRVHDHLNWCVVGVLEGRCLAVDYDRLDDESDPWTSRLAVREASLLERGQVCRLLPPPRTNIHKLANAGPDVAVTLHTYGDPGTKARVFDLVTGRVEVVDLEFHNQPA